MNNDQIVIAGISGRFPQCRNVDEFKEALLKGENLVTENHERYPKGYKNLPDKTAIINDMDKFDASFFGMTSKEVKFTNPRHRILLETAFESILDAGFNPEELKGTKTGVYVATPMSRNLPEKEDREDSYGFSYLGQSAFQAANRISYNFDFKGPSYCVDSACSSSLYAFCNAVSQLRSGEVDYALVLGAHLIINLDEAEEFVKLHVLGDACKVFNVDRNGFALGEAIVSHFLMRKSTSRRIYAEVLSSQMNVDGFKKEGVGSPSPLAQAQLIKSVYRDAGLSLDDLVYIEMHGTGTKVGDIMECQSILSGIEGKKQPLLVGSTKTNAGHSLQASGLVGMTKLLIAMETGIIPRNLYVDNIDSTLPGISSGHLQLTNTHVPYANGILGVNSFGFGGANAHVALQPHGKLDKRLSSDPKRRLIQVSGRTEEAVSYFLDQIEIHRSDEEFLSLVDEIHKHNIEGHPYRGFAILGEPTKREISKVPTSKRPVWFIYSGMGSQWSGMGRTLMHIPVFRDTFMRCAQVLKPYGVDLEELIMRGTAEDMAEIENCFCSLVAISVSLTELLASLGIRPDYMAGHSFGEIGCAYANGDITVEQAVLIGYARAYACKQVQLPPGQMAAVGMSKQDMRKIIPEDIYIACQNGRDTITISGPKESVLKFTKELTEKNIFNKLVETSNIAFHSKYLMTSDKYMLDFLKGVLVDPKPRSSKWISTSVSVDQRDAEWAKYNCPEYHVNNFSNTVLFDEVYQHIQSNAIIIEVSPHALLCPILRREIGPDNSLISLMNRNADDQEEFLLTSIGRIFLSGAQPNLRGLYTGVSFPVSRGTKMLSPLIKWDHSTSYFVPDVKSTHFGQIVSINVSKEEYQFLKGHEIDGRVLMPAAGYMELVWMVLSDVLQVPQKRLPVVFEDVKFFRSTVLPEEENVYFLVNIFRETGYFEIFEGKSVVCSGKIAPIEDTAKMYLVESMSEANERPLIMKREDLYKEWRMDRFGFKGVFQSIRQIDLEGRRIDVDWSRNFTSLIDSLIQIFMKHENVNRDLFVVTKVKRMVIDPKEILKNSDSYLPITFDPHLKMTKTNGIELFDVKFNLTSKRYKIHADPLLESYELINYDSSNVDYDVETSLYISVQIVLQNMNGLVKFVRVGEVVETPNSTGVVENTLERLLLAEVEYVKLVENKIEGVFDVIAIGSNVEDLNSLNKSLKEGGFIIYLGQLAKADGYDVIFRTPCVTLLRSKCAFPTLYETVNIENNDFTWLKKLQEVSKSSQRKTVFLFSQNEQSSGIIGFTKCLMTEDTKIDFKAILIDQPAEIFSTDARQYKNQLSKNLAINVLKNDAWNTYAHVLLKPTEKKLVKNAKVSLKTLGDLATLTWTEMPGFLPSNPVKFSRIIDLKYLALNFRDTLIATGELQVKELQPTDDKINIGYEFSGVTKSGKRVMGMRFTDPFNTELQNDHGLTWNVPDDWTLKEAATVPIVYSTCYYGLIVRAQMREGDTILIHAGAGGVGLAAIHIALSLKATIFTTVSSQEKNDFLLKRFPQLTSTNIGNSRDLSFYNLVMAGTEGRGVDVVLNSLAGEFLRFSMDLLAPEGRFVELGKRDFESGTGVNPEIFLKNCSMHGIMLDRILESDSKTKKEIFQMVQKGIESGVVKPLPTTIFEKTQLEEAWRYLASGKHKGKVLIKLADGEKPGPSCFLATPKVKFNPDKVFIIIGGLGGMGLELAYWLLTKGARKIVLNSRRDIWNGYQTFNVTKWSNYKESTIKINLNDTSKYEEAQNLICESEKLGEIGGIFNTALVLRDDNIFNQTPTFFEDVFKPKLRSCEHLDAITRQSCHHLEYFVVFSSVVAGRGNLGQSNYGMANAAMEKLCENRRACDLPGLAVQWGPVGDVGVLGNDDDIKLGAGHFEGQSIESCLNALETFLLQNVVVGSSAVLKDVRMSRNEREEKTPASVVAHVLGMECSDSIDSTKKLYEFGMDSLMVSEIKQTLYRNFQLELDSKSIRDLTFEQLKSFV